MSQLQAGIRSIIPLSSSVADGSSWDAQAIVCVSICEHILGSGQDLRWLNPVVIGSVIKEGRDRAEHLQCPKAQNIEEILSELDIKSICVAGWTSQNMKTLDSYIAEVSLDRYARMNAIIISMGTSLVVLAANSERIYIIDPHPRNPATGGPPTDRYSKGVIVEISNFYGIGNYLHNYGTGSFDSDATKYTATTLANVFVPVVPDVSEAENVDYADKWSSEPKAEKVRLLYEGIEVKKERVDDDEAEEIEEPTPSTAAAAADDDEKEDGDDDDDDNTPKRSASDMEEEEDESEKGDAADKKQTPKKKKRVIGISKRRKSTRGGKN